MRIFPGCAALSVALIASTTAQTTPGSIANLSPQEMQALQVMQEALPDCALQCLATLIPQAGCAITDVECICTSTQLNQESAICLASNCTVVESFATQRYQKNVCGAPVRDRSHEPIITAWTLFAAVIFCVVARFVARSNRLFNGPGFWWDDWMILVAMPCLLAGNTMTDIMCRRGLGRDVWELTPAEITDVFLLFWTNQFTYVAMLLFAKISILLLYLRIFPSHAVAPWFRNTVWIILALMVAYAISMWFSILFECTPISFAWHSWKGEGGGHCIDLLALIYACAALNIAFDMFVFVLPLPQVWKLQLGGRAKIAVSATFLVGLFATICSIIRLQYLVKWGNSTNPSWDYTDLTIWSLVEGNAVMICACMPPMANLFKKFWEKTSSYLSGSVGKSKSFGYHDHSVGSAGHDMGQFRQPQDKSIAKTETTTVAYDDRAPSERGDEAELVMKGRDPRWDAEDLPRRFV